MSELEEAWSNVLAEAEARARAAGRTDISEYLRLRTSNDLVRNTARQWLFTMFENIAGELNRRGRSIQISKEDHYRFKLGNAVMVGTRLNLKHGVRELRVEVGWPRTPHDGFIRGGGLAAGNLSHMGLRSQSEHLRLIVDPEGVPRWIVEDKRGAHHEIHESDLRKHVSILIDPKTKA